MLPLVKAWLQWKTRKSAAERVLAGKKFNSPPPPPDPKELRVATAQMELITARNTREYIDWLYHPLYEAQSRGAQLFLYPEYVTLPLLGLLPALGGGDEKELDPGEVFRFVAPYMSPIYFQVLGELARKAGIYIGGGSLFLFKQDRLFNTAYLFDPEGEIILAQSKMNLVPQERDWGVETGSGLEVVEIAGGWRIAMPVCMDATYFEIFRLAGAEGAHLALVPIADLNADYSEHMALRGIWGRVQEEPVYGVKSALVGEFFGFKFTGKAGVYGPGEITPDKEGVLDEAKNPEQGAIIEAVLSRTELEIFKRERLVPSGDLYSRYMAKSYEKLLEKEKSEGKRA